MEAQCQYDLLKSESVYYYFASIASRKHIFRNHLPTETIAEFDNEGANHESVRLSLWVVTSQENDSFACHVHVCHPQLKIKLTFL